MASYVEVREELTAKRAQLAALFEESGPDRDMDRITSLPGDSDAKAAELRRRNEELNELGQKFLSLDNLEQIRRSNEAEQRLLTEPAGKAHGGHGGSSAPPGGHARAGGWLLAQLEMSKPYKIFRDGNLGSFQIELPLYGMKTLVQLSAAPPQADRQPMVPMGLETRGVSDLSLQGTTTSNTVDYYEETTFTNAAATVAEGNTKPESTEAWTLRTETVRKIAHNIPATKEALDDIPWLESHLRGRMAFGVSRRENLQLLNGDGTGTNLLGYLNRSGIQTQPKGTDPIPDAIYKAMQLVRGSAGSGFAEPTALVINPADWTKTKLLRTADGIYIWGNPADSAPDRIWGMDVTQTTDITAGTALTGAFRPYAEVFRREGVTVTISTEHSTFFADNKVLVQAESRLALAVYRPSAFATITGL